MSKLRAAPLAALLLLLLLVPAVRADDGDGCVTVTVDGAALFTLAGEVAKGDEYISADNTLYRIESVSGAAATAVRVGQEEMPDVSWLDAGDAQAVFAGSVPAASSGTSSGTDGKQKLIAMYVTHSDESPPTARRASRGRAASTMWRASSATRCKAGAST